MHLLLLKLFSSSRKNKDIIHVKSKKVNLKNERVRRDANFLNLVVQIYIQRTEYRVLYGFIFYDFGVYKNNNTRSVFLLFADF